MKPVVTILQTDAWATFQRDLGHRVIQASGKGWSYLAIVEGGTRSLPSLYVPYGPLADDPDAFDAALTDLKHTARQHKCWFVRIEPAFAAITGPGETGEDALRRRGLKLSPRQVQPGHTQVLDLSQDEKTILAGMTSTNRNLHRNIHKKGVSYATSTDPRDLRILVRYLEETAARNGFHRQSDAYLTQAAHSLMPLGAAVLYIANFQGKPIGASLAYDSDDTRVYAHAAMDHEHRKLSANRPMLARMILDAKAKGLRRFDFFGTAPEGAGPEHEWYGFTTFKESFGGHAESYPGTWDLPLRPVLYRTYTGARAGREKAQDLLRRVRKNRAG